MKNFTRIVTVIVTLMLIGSNIYSQLPGSTQMPLNPKSIPQFVDPLPHFAGLRVDASGGNLTIKYEPVKQVAVSTGTVLVNGTVGPLTPTVGLANFWGYSVSNGTVTRSAHWPAFSIEAKRGTPVNVTYENDLVDAAGNPLHYDNVNLYADQTIHWAAPLGMDMMNMAPYIGPVPVVPHLHGGEVPSESDGGPDAWFTPGYVIKGPSWGNGGTDQNYFYPNTQEAATLWWHDHALGATRLNVYAGLAGFYLLRDLTENQLQLPGWSGDDLVKEVAPVGTSGTFNPNPYLPEIEVVFQDRMFDTQGGLYFPNLPTNPMVHPLWTPEFIGDIITVNGKTWPYLSVAPRKYRLRLLNGSNARFYEIQLQGTAGGKTNPTIVQIGTDGGFLDAPVIINGLLLLAPGERADVVIDFTTSKPGQVWTLTNSARAPYPKGAPPNGSTTGRLMQFVVNGLMVSAANQAVAGTDKSLIPATLRTPLVKLTNFAGGINVIPLPTIKRQLTLNEVMGMGGPLEILVNNSKWAAPISENPTEGTTELWQIINTTADAHPMHLHLVQFQLVSRQPYNVNNYMKAYNAAFPGGTLGGITYLPGAYIPGFGPPIAYNTPNADGAIGGNPAVTPYLSTGLRFANPNEQGWKDTFIAYPGEITTFIIRFAPTDKAANAPAADLLFPTFNPAIGPGYVWHCHIIDHEDNEMMRPYTVQASSARPLAVALKGTSLLPNKSTNGALSLGASIQKSENLNGVVLKQNYPNPFRGVTEIQFTLPEAGHVELTLYNSIGIQVMTLLDAEAPAGLNTVKLDGVNLKPGVYFYKLETGAISQTKRMIIQN